MEAAADQPPRVPRRHATAARMLAHIRRAGRDGVTIRELAGLLSCTISHAETACRLLRDRGQARLVGAAGCRPGLVYLPELAPPPPPIRKKRRRQVAPAWSEEVNARRPGGAARWECGAVVPGTVQVVQGPSGQDLRYTVHALPPGYISPLDPKDCRPWARVVTQGIEP
jgi:hypothetical protein